MQGQRPTRSIAAVALTATALIVGIAGPSSGAAPTTRTITFTSPFNDEGTRVSGLGACGVARPGVCDVRFEGVGTFTGALSTFADYFGYIHFDPGTRELGAESWDHHTGRLQGCGEGSFVMHQTDFDGEYETVDPVAGTMKFTLKWAILPGSGTGAFTGASGSGVALGTLRPDFSNSGYYKGSITCRTGQHS
ncbi:MAG: hypothetical protein LC640_05655 [Frankia sp.]|nr:hypothetical protein [Frankia sp.]